jgi:GH24 family phage-related lysozyme (muramidase)
MATTKQKAAAAAIAASIAIPCEGLRQWAYYDPPGILTVCRGHTGADVVKNRKYSLSECDKLMTDDMKAKVDAVDRCQPGLPVSVLAAFSDAAFNVGEKIACDLKNSTPARLLHQKRYREACDFLLNYNKARVAGVLVVLPGLDNRRHLEREVCVQDLS